MTETGTLPDEMAVLEALTEAAAATGGGLTPAEDGGGWHLAVPHLPRLTVQLTGIGSFPLAWHGLTSGPVALPACIDVGLLGQALAACAVPSPLAPPSLPGLDQLPGWAVLQAGGNGSAGWQLARTDQSAHGWPATVGLLWRAGCITLQVRQPLAASGAEAQAAITHLLAPRGAGLVQTRYLNHDLNEARLEAGPHVTYEFLTPAATLSPAYLAAALAILGTAYRVLAPTLVVLAQDPLLVQAYLACNGDVRVSNRSTLFWRST